MPSFHFLDADDADLSKLLYPTGYNLSASSASKKLIMTPPHSNLSMKGD